MDKNEILAKSRKEYYNKVDDERDVMLKLKARTYGIYVAGFLLFFLFYFNRAYRGYLTGELFILFWGYRAGVHLGEVVNATRSKEKVHWTSWCMLIFVLCLLIHDLVVFFLQG